MQKNSLKKLYIQRGDSPSKDAKRKFRRLFLRLVISSLFGLLIAVIVRSYFLYPIKITNKFMEPTLKKDKYIFISPIFNKGNLKVGDVVLAKNLWNEKTVFLSRIIGKPGDKVQITNKKLYRNFNLIDEESKSIQYSDKRNSFPKSFSKRDNMDEVYVIDRNYFLLSDNRDESLDSRELGLIPEENIIGKMVF